MEFQHIPVLLTEVIEGLQIQPDGIYVDGTVGGAGHALEIAKRLNGGKLFGLDRDPDAVAAATERLSGYPATVIQCNFDEMARVFTEFGIDAVDGVLLDLGVSSHQLDEPSRGFSYHADAPLDMRMSRSGVSAYDLVNSADESTLSDILFRYGEEKNARAITRKILQARTGAPVRTTLQLAEIVQHAVPPQERRKKNPCRKTFQAIRIAVNGEMDHLESGLQAAFSYLKPGGRLAVITFHSLEDRLVKQQFAAWCQGCTCPPEFPVCVCGKTPVARRVTRKPISPSEEELERNPRSRSAKLRILEKIGKEASWQTNL